MSRIPNIVIFRLPAEDAEDSIPLFAQISIGEDGLLVAESFQAFAVGADDSYRNMQYDQVKFAHLENNSSLEICGFSLFNDKENEPAKVWEIGIDDFNVMLPGLLAEIEKSQKHEIN